MFCEDKEYPDFSSRKSWQAQQSCQSYCPAQHFIDALLLGPPVMSAKPCTSAFWHCSRLECSIKRATCIACSLLYLHFGCLLLQRMTPQRIMACRQAFDCRYENFLFYGGSKWREMCYYTHLAAMTKVFNALGILSGKKPQAPRGSGARDTHERRHLSACCWMKIGICTLGLPLLHLQTFTCWTGQCCNNDVLLGFQTLYCSAGSTSIMCVCSVDIDDIAMLGKWNNEHIVKSYVNGVPVAAVLARAGHDNLLHVLPRNTIEPDQCLSDEIFPGIEKMLQQKTLPGSLPCSDLDVCTAADGFMLQKQHQKHSQLSACLPACLSVRLSVCSSVCLSVCMSVCLYVCLSAKFQQTICHTNYKQFVWHSYRPT